MNPTVRSLPFFLFCAFPSFWAASDTPRTAGVVQIGGAHRDDVRRTVQNHRATQRDEMRRGEAVAGRRLTPAELAELRSQIRQQWAQRLMAEDAASGGAHDGVVKGIDDVSHKPVRPQGGKAPSERPPGSVPSRSQTMPRSQRP
jgi:hypothetical protein